MGTFNFKKGNIGNTICCNNNDEENNDEFYIFETIKQEIEDKKNKFIENSFLNDCTYNPLSEIIDINYEKNENKLNLLWRIL